MTESGLPPCQRPDCLLRQHGSDRTPLPCGREDCFIREPPPLAPLEKELQRFITFRRVAWVVVAILIIGFSSLGFVAYHLGTTSSTLTTIQLTELHADCIWWEDIGTAPVVITPPLVRPGRLGIQLEDDARLAFNVQHCPGVIGPVPKDLAKWAAYYHLPKPAT